MCPGCSSSGAGGWVGAFVGSVPRLGACRATSGGPDRLADCTSRPAAAAKAEAVSVVSASWRRISASLP
ncbi:MAG: hypothetical protein QM783_05835 [Phycisphaerales bacterium]